jgi:hypothetical protein
MCTPFVVAGARLGMSLPPRIVSAGHQGLAAVAPLPAMVARVAAPPAMLAMPTPKAGVPLARPPAAVARGLHPQTQGHPWLLLPRQGQQRPQPRAPPLPVLAAARGPCGL